jgi:undecaprenyl-diphosphatase
MHFNIFKKANKLDTLVLFTINKHIQNKYLDVLMPMVTKLGNLGTIWIAIAILLLLDKPYRMIGIIVLVTLILSTIIGEGVVKHLVRRIRPCIYGSKIKLLITKPMSYSFPSGHTLSSFAVADVLSVYFTEYKLIFIGIAFMIALSRIYLYAHYPTDIIFGIILGLLCSKLVLNGLQEGYLQKFIVVYKSMR